MNSKTLLDNDYIWENSCDIEGDIIGCGSDDSSFYSLCYYLDVDS